MMNVGVRAHDYGKQTVEDLASILNEKGYSCAQLAIPKAFKGIESYDDITFPLIEKIRTEFERKNIQIAVMGCYMDMGNPDPAVREKAVATFKKCIAFNKELGADVVGTETAYPHLTEEEKKIWKPYMIDSIQRITEEAVRLDVKIAIEPVWWHPLKDADTLLEVLNLVDDKHLRVIFDASNQLEHPESTDQTAYWGDWMTRAGEYIDILHIKDFVFEQDGTYVPKLLGEGAIDYTVIRQWVHANKPNIPLLREEMNPAKDEADLQFLRSF